MAPDSRQKDVELFVVLQFQVFVLLTHTAWRKAQLRDVIPPQLVFTRWTICATFLPSRCTQFGLLDQAMRQRHLASLELFLSCAQKQLAGLMEDSPVETPGDPDAVADRQEAGLSATCGALSQTLAATLFPVARTLPPSTGLVYTEHHSLMPFGKLFREQHVESLQEEDMTVL
ncbi:coiled-coil domain-containing protein 91 isoform X1 [Arapaima gigas]